MTNVFESAKDYFKTIVDNEDKIPFHIGEVTNFWILLTMIEDGIAIYQMGLNTTNDDDLIHTLKNGEQSSKVTATNLRIFFKKRRDTITSFC